MKENIATLLYFLIMWKAAAGHQINNNEAADDDDWDTDADYVNNMTEEEQRYGSKREIGAIK